MRRAALAAFVAACMTAPLLGLAAEGRLSAPLDDGYIHLQYARSIADGHAFAYHPGDEASSGASSLLWVWLLVPFDALGLGEDPMMWVALALGAVFLALALLAAARMLWRTDRAGPAAWLVLGAWGWLGWHAVSGMEVTLACAAVMGLWEAIRRWVSLRPEQRSFRAAALLLALGASAPWIRPEAAPFAGLAGLVVMAWPARGRGRFRILGALPWITTALFPVFWWAVTGTARTNGAAAKWMLVHPYLHEAWLLEGTLERVRFAWDFWRGGGSDYTLGFFPRWLMVVLAPLGIVASLRAARTRRVTLLLWGATLASLGILATFGTFHAHRFRYLVPYLLPLVAWCGGAVWLLGRAPSTWLRRRGHRVPLAPVATTAVAVAILLVSWPEAHAHYARATEELRRQHHSVADRIAELPEDAIIGINDAGVIAYRGGRRTYDLVGLTTNDAAVPYLLGAGAIHERLESLPAGERPTHFAVHTTWFPARHLLGATIGRYDVRFPMAIVGAETMELRTARMDGLDRGGWPVHVEVGGLEPRDDFDLCDVRDEARHEYLHPRREWQDMKLVSYATVGGRFFECGWDAQADHFTMRGAPGRETLFVVRTHGLEAARVKLVVDGEELGVREVPQQATWVELSWTLPAERARETHQVHFLREGGRIPAFHWWTYARP